MDRGATDQGAAALGTPAPSPEPGLRVAAVTALPRAEPHYVPPPTQESQRVHGDGQEEASPSALYSVRRAGGWEWWARP